MYWLLSLVLAHFAYTFACARIGDTGVSYVTILALLLAAGFPFIASWVFPFQRLWTFSILAIIWIPFDHRVTSEFWKWPDHLLGYPFAAFLIVNLCLFTFLTIRPQAGLLNDKSSRTNSLDLAKCLVTYLILTALLLPVGLATDFIHNFGIPHWHRPVVLALGIFFTIALPEELVFRGILQNLLSEKFPLPVSIVISAGLFGMTHWNNGSQLWDWRYLSLASVAGVGYGISYAWSRKLIVPIIVHTLIDTTWVAFFK